MKVIKLIIVVACLLQITTRFKSNHMGCKHRIKPDYLILKQTP